MAAAPEPLPWLSANGATGCRLNAAFTISTHPSGDRVLIASTPLGLGQVLAAYPERLTVQCGDSIVNDVVYPDAPWNVRLAAQIVLWRHRPDRPCPSGPYFASLPPKVPSPLGDAFPWKAIKALQYPVMQAALARLLSWVTAEVVPRLTETGLLRTPEERATFEWALAAVHSRAFVWNGERDDQRLLPLVDLANHRGDTLTGSPSAPTVVCTANVAWHHRPASGPLDPSLVELVTIKSVSPGEEVVLSYGERSNDDFFLHYGFVPVRNPHDEYVLFEDWSEAEDWLRLHGACGLEDIHNARTLIEGVYRDLPVPRLAHYTTPTGRSRLYLFPSGSVDPRLRSAFGAAHGGDADAADAALRRRCWQLLTAHPASLIDDLTWLVAHGDGDHPFEALRGYYAGHPAAELKSLTDPTDPLEPCNDTEEGVAEHKALALALTYRAYKKAILVDYLIADD